MPWGYGLFGLGWNSLALRSGYCNYANPYYGNSYFAPSVDYYSTPIVLADYETSTSGYLGDPIPTQDVDEAGLADFDLARENFQLGQYQAALAATEAALLERPDDPIVHEFRALCLFALGEYRKAAVVLNSLLATAPGWDWATMVGLYMNPQEYERHLRALEGYRNANPNDASARFVLAYQYLVCGQKGAAEKELRKTMALEPTDVVAAQLLAGLTGEAPPEQPAPAAPSVEPGANEPSDQPEGANPEAPAQQTDMVGQWSARRSDGATFQFSLNDQGGFDWMVRTKEGKETKFAGTYTFAEDLIVLESTEQGTMIGRVSSEGPDKFQFKLIGGPANDPGLAFQRVKE